VTALRILLDATCIAEQRATGSARYVGALVAALSEHDSENRYVVYGFEENPFGALPENFEYRRAPLLSVLGPLAREISRRRFVYNICREEKFDIVHSVLDMAPMRVASPKTVFTLFDVARLDPVGKDSFGRLTFRTQWRMRMRYGQAKRAGRVITTSNASADAIRRFLGIPVRKIDVVHIAHDRIFTPGVPDEKILGRFGLDDGPYALFVGQFGRQKNEEGLIDAFFAAGEAGGIPENAALVLVGDKSTLSPRASEKASKRRSRGRVIFTGPVPDADLVHLYRGARCLCLTSFYEGYGLPVQEALACGTPSLVSKDSCLSELAGPAGLTADPASISGMADALSRLMTDDGLRRALTDLCLERARSFSAGEMAKKHLDIYRKAIDSGENVNRQYSGNRQ
jgi:glycosyltransferase involved in cell wall biosynthesis